MVHLNTSLMLRYFQKENPKKLKRKKEKERRRRRRGSSQSRVSRAAIISTKNRKNRKDHFKRQRKETEKQRNREKPKQTNTDSMAITSSGAWLIAMMIGAPVIFCFVNFNIMKYYMSKEDMGKAWIPKILIMVGLLFAEAAVLLVPLDVANGGGASDGAWLGRSAEA